jgi:hypothetical protein
MTAHYSEIKGKVVRVLDGTGQSPAMIDYLGQRLTAQLRHISTKLTAKMESRAATVNDVKQLASDSYLVAILGKGAAGQALALCDAQPIQASQHSKQELRAALNVAFSGGVGSAGVTWKGVSIVPIVQLAPFSDESSQASNRTFLSNLLIHEVGHLVSQHLPQKDHATGGVMRSTLTSSDPELGYSAAFIKLVGARFR